MTEAERETLERLMHYLERKSAMKDAAAIRAVLEQNERLRAASRYRNTHDVRASRIDAALKIAEDTLLIPEYKLPRIVKALKGEA